MSTDAVAEWKNAADRVCDLVMTVDQERMMLPVPATPAWSAHDLFAHMVGLGVDVVAGDEPDDHNATWTQRQVDERAGRSTEEIVDEWRSVAPDLMSWMRANGPRPLSDVIIHEHDLRGAFDTPGARDVPGVDLVRDRMLGRFGSAVKGLPPILLDCGDWHWVSAGDPAEAPTALRLSRFEAFRALTTRRTEDQLRGWVTRGDIEPYLPAFSGLGTLPRHALPE